MQAFVFEHGELKIKEMPDPTPGKNDVIVKLKTAGLNRRDLYIPNRRGNDKDALILGSDGAGIIESIGAEVTSIQPGDEVIINPGLRWKENTPAPPESFDILGMPDHGTFAEKIVLSEDQVEKKPSHLTWDEAGVLALAALTGYRALVTKGQVKALDTVFIPGAGSGVSTYMLQFAKSLGAKVIVTSRSEEKLGHAKDLGADLAIATESDWKKELEDEVIDLVIDSVGRATFNRSLEILKKGGRIVVFGATTEDNIDLNLREFFYGQYQLFGSTMGSREELRELLQLMEEKQLRPVVDKVFPLEEANQALTYLKDSNQFGKVALKMEN